MAAPDPTDAAAFVAESLSLLRMIFERPAEPTVRLLGRPLAERVARWARAAPLMALAAAPPAEADPVHGLRVGLLAAALGARWGLGPASCAALAYGALMHDLGKTLIADDIRKRAPVLEAGERELYLQHPEFAVGLLIAHGSIDALARDAVVAHHERLDGRGSPYGLMGDAVPLGGRLVAVADAYDAWMRRPGHRAPRSALAALDALSPGLDPAVVALLEQLVDEGLDGAARRPAAGM